MLTLLSECHFYSLRDEISIKATDYGAFRYCRSRDYDSNDQYAAVKREYVERRNGTVLLKNHKKSRLKDKIKRLELLLKTQKVCFSQWKDAAIVLILFSNGIILHVCIDIYTGDISRLGFDNFLTKIDIGKNDAENVTITDAIFTQTHIILAYNTNQITVVYLQKPNVRPHGPEKISKMDPKVFHVLIPGPSDRRLPRNLSVNSSFQNFIVWTKSSQNEVYPWRPSIRDQDRANIHVFKLSGPHVESISYCWTENDPISVSFMKSSESHILTVEQKISSKGAISAEICTYEICTGKMQRTALSSISVGTQISVHAFSPDQEKLILATVDRNLCLHDLVRQSSKFSTQMEFNPNQCAWHSDSSIIILSNERSQFQCFDLALNLVANQLQSEDVTPLKLLDLSHYFTILPNLMKISFSCKPDLSNFTQHYAQTDCFLLLIYENGPIGCLRYFASAGMRGDIHNSGLTADVIVDKYLALNQLEKAVNLLISINWETYGAMCLISLHKIANYIFFRCDKRKKRIELMLKVLKTFSNELSDETKDEFSNQVFDLKRRFFFFLLRNNLLSEAFEIAQDVKDYDLFMDLFNFTKGKFHLIEFANAAFTQAAAILNDKEPGECYSETSSSHSSCSEINQNHKSSNKEGQMRHEKALTALKNYVPPLPSFKSKIFNADGIKIHIPKPELHVEGKNLPNPPLPDLRYFRKDSKAVFNGQRLCLVRSDQPAAHSSEPHLNFHPSDSDQYFGIPSIPKLPTKLYNASHNIQPRSRNSAIPSNTNQRNSHYNIGLDNLLTPPSTTYKAVTYPKFYQHPLVSGTIPPSAITPNDDIARRQSKKPAFSILSNGSASATTPYGGVYNAATTANLPHSSNVENNIATIKRDSGERNKVKFSETVQVEEIPRKEKIQITKRSGYIRPAHNLTNPKKELADSLPLCHPNDDYLKDFNPVSDDSWHVQRKENNSNAVTSKSSSKTAPSIKVVHFGVV